MSKIALVTGCTGRRLIVPPKKCKHCGKEFNRDSCNQLSDFKEKKFCSRKCFTDWNTKENHPLYKGETRFNGEGYLRYRDDKFVHRKLMEKHLGRKLEKYEVVHHINGIKTDNRIENLELLTNSEHRKIHAKRQTRDKKGRFI